MKLLHILIHLLTAILLFASCSGDQPPASDRQSAPHKASLRICFNADSSRASTADELKISSVCIYVFDSNGSLETSQLNLSPEADAVNIEATPGRKTVYALSGRPLISPSPTMTLADFEDSAFDYSLSDLQTDESFAMIGKATITVQNSESPTDCRITLIRLAAKVQVAVDPNLSSLKTSLAAIGIQPIKKAEFCVMQACPKMRVVPDGSDVFDFATASNTAGTYDGFENAPSFSSALSTSSKPQYLPENIPSNPTSGNTSFAALRLQVIPKKVTEYRSNTKGLYEYDGYKTTLYTVGVYDDTTGQVDYAINDKNVIIYFYVQSEAKNYITAMKKGGNKKLTLTSGPADESDEPELFTFTDGWVYYRINIEDTDADGYKRYQVRRNNFYTINIKSINQLGYPSLSHLIPTDPTSPVDPPTP